jgi:hypothetical protein|tara:strand:+ start:347 stop:580 length:234 start_codon:yes stop_codon:yes gene_type:complete
MALQVQATTLPDVGFAKLIIRAYENPDGPWLKQLGVRIDHYRLKGKSYDQISRRAQEVTDIEAGDWEALMQLLDEMH